MALTQVQGGMLAGSTNTTTTIQSNGTTAITVNSSQNVGIGTTSPQARLHQSSTNDGVQAIFTGAQTGTTQTILLRSQYQTNNGTAGFANIGWFDNGSQGGGLTFGTTSNGGGTTGTPTERMRIDSSGNLLVGNNTASPSVSGNLGFINLASTANTETQITWAKATQVEAHAGFKTSTDSNFYINTGGALGTFGVYLTNTGTSWTSNSDERLKENLVPITDATNKVSQLRAVIGNYINDESKKARPFLIAQDVQAVLPEAISVNTDELGTLGVSYTDVIPLLVASIKELKAELDATKAEVAALKAAP